MKEEEQGGEVIQVRPVKQARQGTQGTQATQGTQDERIGKTIVEPNPECPNCNGHLILGGYLQTKWECPNCNGEWKVKE